MFSINFSDVYHIMFSAGVLLLVLAGAALMWVGVGMIQSYTDESDTTKDDGGRTFKGFNVPRRRLERQSMTGVVSTTGVGDNWVFVDPSLEPLLKEKEITLLTELKGFLNPGETVNSSQVPLIHSVCCSLTDSGKSRLYFPGIEVLSENGYLVKWTRVPRYDDYVVSVTRQ